MKKSVLLLIIITLSIVIIASVGTSIEDFFMPGSQPGDSGNIEHPDKCDNCHGGYDQAVEPAFNWRGSMMAQAARDPLFYACMAIAEQDAPGSGDLCIRCHAPDGWLNGRSTPTDGSALNNNDREGVQCDFCHKLVKPADLGLNPFTGNTEYTNITYPSDQEYLAKITMIPPQSGNGMYVAHDGNAKRGPFIDAAAKHQMLYSPFHSESAICGTCHDVSSPAIDKDGNPVFGGDPTTADGFLSQNMLPVERTYSEWTISDFANGPVTGTAFGGNKINEGVSTCQDCHMADVSGYAANKRGTIYRNDLPLHDMTGGNTFIPDLVYDLYPDEVDRDALMAGKERALFMLQNAATMDLSVTNNIAKVTITNNTGHKLPSGYPEGRRIWVNLQAYDANGNILFESGAYNYETAELNTIDAKIYEIHLGMTDLVEEAAGVYGDPETGESFHFVLNNKVLKDNRIPPRGATNQELISIQSPVVAYSYNDNQNYDLTSYEIPANTTFVKARLLYQTVSLEFAKFLRDENTTNEAGNIFWNAYVSNGMSAPVVMCEQEWGALTGGVAPVADFDASTTSGDAPLTVLFTDQSTNSPTSWNWNFGGLGTSTAQNPEFTFVSPGIYDVSLTVSNNFGSDNITKTITVNENTTPGDPVITATFGTWETINVSKGSKKYAVTVTTSPVVSGATITGNFDGAQSQTQASDGNGSVIFESPEFKGNVSMCLTISAINTAGYVFEGPVTDCTAKSAQILAQSISSPHINVYPNPFTDKLYFEFSREEDAACIIELFDVSGRKLDVLFDQNIVSGKNYRIEYQADKKLPSLLFYRVQFNDEVINGKIIHE
ncbi:PKD domain-containing protein [Draconibacterium sediminis]|uniref:PKD domain-containing protein n=1 Tax=Draconibacterium sediminis TaxID=1544798 RepID=UPI0026ECF1F1|nr:PKD domain-containing protein [Draconibacterium sediminis]